MYKGVRYRISCADLRLPREAWTQEKSYQAANAWWQGKRASLDSLPAHPHANILADLQERLDYAQSHNRPEEAGEVAQEIEVVRTLDEDCEPIPAGASKFLEILRAFGWDGPALDPLILRGLTPAEHVWADRLRRSPTVPPDRTIGYWADKWLATKADEAKQGVRAQGGLKQGRVSIIHFRDFAGADSSLEGLTPDLWERWGLFCQGKVAQRDQDPKQGWAGGYASKVYHYSKSFCKWMWEQGALKELPRNFDRRCPLHRPAAAIKTYTNAEVNALLQAAKDQHKLHILLALNTGAYPIDIATLRRTEIDLGNGTITRRRHKTRKQKYTPLVSYPLWPETLRLLGEFMAREGQLALLTPNGNPWVNTTVKQDGKVKEKKPIATYHSALCRRTGLAGSFKTFRKTSATRLRSNPKYADLRHHFLGESARSISDLHYAAVDPDLFCEAVNWLGQQYGLA
jgi:integrase